MDENQSTDTRAILRLGLLLLVPTTLNMVVGSSLGIWFAPYPEWMFRTLFVFPPLPFILPSALFFLIAYSLNKGKPWAKIIAVLIYLSAIIVQVSWTVYWFEEGVNRLGLPYTATVTGMGFLVLSPSIWLFINGMRKQKPFRIVLGYWFCMLWLAWCAVPWLDEAV